MKRAIEKSKFNSTFLEEAMEIQRMISCGVIMLMIDTTTISIVCWAIPDLFDRIGCDVLIFFHGIEQVFTNWQTPTIFSASDCKGIINNFLPTIHEVSFPLTNIYHIPHGEACGLTLDYFIRINAKGEGGERVEEFARRIGFKDAEEMADAVLELKKKMGLRCDLKDLELDDDQIADLVRISRHPNLYNNPVEITDEMLDEMYRYLAGK